MIMLRAVSALWIQQSSDGQTEPQANHHPSSTSAFVDQSPFICCMMERSLETHCMIDVA